MCKGFGEERGIQAKAVSCMMYSGGYVAHLRGLRASVHEILQNNQRGQTLTAADPGAEQDGWERNV